MDYNPKNKSNKKIAYGKVVKYFTDKDFGFVSMDVQINGFEIKYNSYSKDVFFHIKTIKKTQPSLFELLVNHKLNHEVNFWYEYDESTKGSRVKSILKANEILDKSQKGMSILIENVETLWVDMNSRHPGSPVMSQDDTLFKATEDLLGIERTIELYNERVVLEVKSKQSYLDRLIKEQGLRKNDGYEPDMMLDDMHLRMEIDELSYQIQQIKDPDLEAKKENEFQDLVNEITPLGFTHSKEVSNYIMSNKLGDKYKNISGVLELQNEENKWEYNGGILPEIYKRLCRQLNLSNETSGAKVAGFKSFKEIDDN